MRKETLGRILILLSVFGICLSVLLTYIHFNSAEGLCIPGQEAGCDAVNKGPWSEMFGIPISLLGLIYYSLLMYLSWHLFTGTKTISDIPVLDYLYLWGLFGVLFSMYLTSLEIFVIHAICMWCIISALNIFTIAVLIGMNTKDSFRIILKKFRKEFLH